MKTVRINIGSGYDLTVGSGMIKSLGKHIRSVDSLSGVSRAMVVFDRNTADLYSDGVMMSLKLAGYTPYQYVVKADESARRLGTVADVCSAAAASGMKYGDVFIAVGGTIACDIAGLAASLYLGGSPYVTVPTTLLAQVSRSVGGKVNADLPEGRRTLGTYWTPAAVFCDTDVLSTQTKASRDNGMAELIKLGCIASEKLLGELDSLERDPGRVIAQAVALRAKIAVKNERLASERSLLHFGDLICQALEDVSDYSLYHGEALSIGMAITCAAGERAGLTQAGTTDRLEAILKHHGLPVTTNIPAERLLRAVTEDPYASGRSFSLPLIKSIGSAFQHRIAIAELRDFFVESLPDWVISQQ